MERKDALEEKHTLDNEKNLRMDRHCLTLMQNVLSWRSYWRQWLQVVNILHTVFLSSKAGLSRMATIQVYVNLTVRNLMRLYQGMEGKR